MSCKQLFKDFKIRSTPSFLFFRNGEWPCSGALSVQKAMCPCVHVCVCMFCAWCARACLCVCRMGCAAARHTWPVAECGCVGPDIHPVRMWCAPTCKYPCMYVQKSTPTLLKRIYCWLLLPWHHSTPPPRVTTHFSGPYHLDTTNLISTHCWCLSP